MRTSVNFAMRKLVDGIGTNLWPARCLVCDGPCLGQPSGRDLCAHCELDLPWSRAACARCAIPLPLAAAACGQCLRKPPPLDATTAAFVYAAPLDRLLPRLKFHDGLPVARLLGELMREAFAGAEQPQALIPVPLHAQRLRERGFDQALELARPLARVLGTPLRLDLLRRDKPTAAQSRLDAAQRRANLRGAFSVAASADLPAHVALFDDVMTTGATLHVAAQALKRAGVKRVDAWVCARVP